MTAIRHSRRYVWEIILGAHAIFAAEESLVQLPVEDGMTVDVIGDVHGIYLCIYSQCEYSDNLIGQFYDMLHLYSLTGEPSDNHCLLMNGDLVDRGSWSIEVILTCFAYKCLSIVFVGSYAEFTIPFFAGLYPKRMFINRGNHEAKDMNRQYGFEGEAKHKHGEQTYKVVIIAIHINRE